MHRYNSAFLLALMAGSGLFSGAAFATDTTPLKPLDAETAPAPGEKVVDSTKPPIDDKGIFSIVFENDVFAGTDQGYTNGVRLAWLSSETKAPDWVKWSADHFLPLSPDGDKRIGIAAGQSMFAPEDLSKRTPILNDRPYAGWLYGSVGIVSDTGKTLDNVQLTVGVVGPYSLAEQTQKFVHAHITDSPTPEGWDNQLKTEPGFILTYERKWRSLYELSPFGLGFDITPSAGVNLGNVETDAIGSLTFRIGYDLPADYGPPRVRPSLPGSDFFVPTDEFGGYLFAGFEGRGIARNIFLDGNTFAHSQSVSKEPLLGTAQFGVAMTYGEARLSYTHVFMTKEFYEQQTPERFGVVTLSYRF